MRQSLLKIIHTISLRRAKQYNYLDFPEMIPSLNISDPNKDQIIQDYITINDHFNHPVFINFVPTYDQLIVNKELAWLRLY